MALLIVASVGAWPISSLASLNSVNKMNLSRFFEAPWLAQEMTARCITYMLGQSVPHCPPTKTSSLIPDDTSCESVGSHLSLWTGTTSTATRGLTSWSRAFTLAMPTPSCRRSALPVLRREQAVRSKTFYQDRNEEAR